MLLMTKQVKAALKEMDLTEMMRLAEDHQQILDTLQDAGLCCDVNLIDMIQKLFGQVQDVIAEIRCCQNDVFNRMKQVSDGKKLMHAYSK
ncbi:MAG: hypothetical protein WA151_02695 [Desulfatirhabdiaceae bacterium]